MAEEKKEKKTTTKKSGEEVKVEKKFCTKCGKELSGDQVCDCSKEVKSNEVVTVNSDALLNTCKSVWNTIIGVFKKPDTTIKEEIERKETSNAVVLLVVLAITFALYIMAAISSGAAALVTSINSSSYGLISYSSSDLDIPYFKIFIYGLIIYALMAIIPMLASLVVAKFTKNSTYSFKRALKLYVASNAPLALGYLVMAVILLINVNILNIIGMIALAIISISCFFNFILSFNKEITVQEDRRSYALTSVLIIWVVVEVIVLCLVAGSVYTDINDSYSKTSNSSYPSFNWD